MSDKSSTSDSVSSVLKTIGILQALASEKDIGITELSNKLMQSKSTVYRFLQTLKTLGIVRQEGETDRYLLTLKLFEIGSQALENIDLIEFANTEMVKISNETKEALHLGSLDEDSIIYIHKIDSKYNLRMQSRIGRRNPLYSTAIGKVLLAPLGEDAIREILKDVEFIASTVNTCKSIDELILQLPIVLEQGFGEDNEEQEIGLRCIAVPIFDRFGQVTAGMSISLPTIRFTEEKKKEYIETLHKSAAKISNLMGYTDYPY